MSNKRLLIVTLFVLCALALTGCIDQIIFDRGTCPGASIGVPCDNAVKANGVIAISFESFVQFCAVFTIALACAALLAGWIKHVQDNDQRYQIQKYLHDTMQSLDDQKWHDAVNDRK